MSPDFPAGDADLVRLSPGDDAALVRGETGQPPVTLVVQAVALHGGTVNRMEPSYNHPTAICGNPVP
jgi:hypothetical protein